VSARQGLTPCYPSALSGALGPVTDRAHTNAAAAAASAAPSRPNKPNAKRMVERGVGCAGSETRPTKRTDSRASSHPASDFPHPFRWPEVMLPWAMAETICREVAVFLGVPLPRRYARWLTAKAEVCFRAHPRWHWLAA